MRCDGADVWQTQPRERVHVPRCGCGASVNMKTELLECTPELAMVSTPAREWRPIKFSSIKFLVANAECPPRPLLDTQSPPMMPTPFRTE